MRQREIDGKWRCLYRGALLHMCSVLQESGVGGRMVAAQKAEDCSSLELEGDATWKLRSQNRATHNGKLI